MPSNDIRRVMVYRLGSLGDHLVAVPSYKLVRRAFPQAEITLLTNIPVAAKAAAAEAVLGGSGLVDRYLTYVVGERSPLALLKLALAIRRQRPQVMVYLAGARGIAAAERDRKFFRLCGVKKIVGLPVTEDLQNNRPMATHGTTPWFEHEGERLARCVAELGDAHVEDPANWTPNLTEEDRAAAAPLGERPFFAMSLGTKAQSNHWTIDNWMALAERLGARYPEYGLVMLGAENEAVECELVASAWDAGSGFAGLTRNLCGTINPRKSAAIMERARLFLGHDSGPAHMAASVGTPVVGVYSARMKPGEWVPHGEHVRVLMHWVDCGGCLLETCVEQKKKCILSITVDEVLGVVDEQMSRERR